MGKIIVSENLSLDGVGEDPTGEDGFRHGGWFNEIGNDDRAASAPSASSSPRRSCWDGAPMSTSRRAGRGAKASGRSG